MLEFFEEIEEEKMIYRINIENIEDGIIKKMKIITSYHPLGLMYGNRIEYLYDISFEPPTITINVYRRNYSWNGTGAKKIIKFSVELPDDYETPWWLDFNELKDAVETQKAKETVKWIFDYLKDLLSWISSEYLNLQEDEEGG